MTTYLFEAQNAGQIPILAESLARYRILLKTFSTSAIYLATFLNVPLGQNKMCNVFFRSKTGTSDVDQPIPL